MGEVGQYHWQGRPSKAQLAALLLGVELPTTEEAVKAAYRVAVKANHPDTGTGSVSMADLQGARDLLLAAVKDGAQSPVDSQNRNCFFCNGSGIVSNGFAAEPCSVCGGTGVAK